MEAGSLVGDRPSWRPSHHKVENRNAIRILRSDFDEPIDGSEIKCATRFAFDGGPRHCRMGQSAIGHLRRVSGSRHTHAKESGLNLGLRYDSRKQQKAKIQRPNLAHPPLLSLSKSDPDVTVNERYSGCPKSWRADEN